MIRIGLKERSKKLLINQYLKENPHIDKIYCFYFEEFPIKLNLDISIEYIEFEETIMYRTFYPLLERIDKNTLLIFNECMRTQNRSDLHYNCMHHYINQCGHKIVFEYFPIIETRDDFMILLDFENKGKYRGKPFEYSYLKDEDVLMKPYKFNLETQIIKTTDAQKEDYKKEKESLFDNIGMKDPNTIPRNLQLYAGNFKKQMIENGKFYIARNKRFKAKNVFTYKEAEKGIDYIVLDFHYRRLNFNDFLKKTEMTTIPYIFTDLSIDDIMIKEFVQWKARLEAVYGKANLC